MLATLKRFIVYTMLQSGLLCLGYALADAQKVFTDDDLKGYKSTPDFEVSSEKRQPAAVAKQAKQEAAPESGKGHTEEYYCRRGTEHKNRIKMAKEGIKQTKSNLEDLSKRYGDVWGYWGGNFEGRIARAAQRSMDNEELQERKKLKTYETELIRAEQELRDFEMEAHRKNIPPGWIRCQF